MLLRSRLPRSARGRVVPTDCWKITTKTVLRGISQAVVDWVFKGSEAGFHDSSFTCFEAQDAHGKGSSSRSLPCEGSRVPKKCILCGVSACLILPGHPAWAGVILTSKRLCCLLLLLLWLFGSRGSLIFCVSNFCRYPRSLGECCDEVMTAAAAAAAASTPSEISTRSVEINCCYSSIADTSRPL